MKGITKIILLLTLFSYSLLPACGKQIANENIPPNADHLIALDQNGVGTLRGNLSGGSFSAKATIVFLSVPVKVDGISSNISVPINLRADTEISSSLTTNNTVREYLTFHKGSSILDAFPSQTLVDVTIHKTGIVFEATAIHEAGKKFALFEQQPKVENVIVTNNLSQGTIIGSIKQGSKTLEGEVSWWVSLPIEMNGVKVQIPILVYATPDTQIITKDGVVPYTSRFSWDQVKIEFTRSGDTLTARTITELP